MTIFELHLFGLTLAPTWYWLMYAIGFFLCYEYVKREGFLRHGDMDSFLFFVFLGVILGGRLGYVILYSLPYFSNHPTEVLEIWKWGMSFHGGAIGVIISIFLFAMRKRYRVFDVSDPLVTILPVALGLGRIGNLINRELLGFAQYSWPLAIVQNGVSHFPSPLLEAFLEGFVLLTIMLTWRIYEKKSGRIPGYTSALFLLGYGIFRMIAECFRLPDTHIGYLFWTHFITLGMIYTLPMLVGSVIVFLFARRQYRSHPFPVIL